MMEKLFTGLLEAAKKDKKNFARLKTAVVHCQQYELAANLRDIEKELFPESQEEREARIKGGEIGTLLRMVEINISDEYCWLIAETLKAHSKKKGKFSINEACDLVLKMKRLFDK